MTGNQDMRTDTTLTWNLLRVNLPTIFAIAGVGLYINNGLLKAQEKTEGLERSMAQVQIALEPVSNLQYRINRVEDSAKEAHIRIDGLSSSMMNNIDLIRRDISVLTTQIEVLSTRVGMVIGDEGSQRRTEIQGPQSITTR